MSGTGSEPAPLAAVALLRRLEEAGGSLPDSDVSDQERHAVRHGPFRSGTPLVVWKSDTRTRVRRIYLASGGRAVLRAQDALVKTDPASAALADEERDAVSLEWEGNGFGVVLVVSPDGGASYSIRNADGFYREMADFDLPGELVAAIRQCTNG